MQTAARKIMETVTDRFLSVYRNMPSLPTQPYLQVLPVAQKINKTRRDCCLLSYSANIILV